MRDPTQSIRLESPNPIHVDKEILITKHTITFFYKGKELKLSDKIGELNLGMNNTPLLCLKGGLGFEAPKEFMRFPSVSDTDGQLITYLSDDENMDAISFTVFKPLQLVGFSVY